MDSQLNDERHRKLWERNMEKFEKAMEEMDSMEPSLMERYLQEFLPVVMPMPQKLPGFVKKLICPLNSAKVCYATIDHLLNSPELKQLQEEKCQKCPHYGRTKRDSKDSHSKMGENFNWDDLNISFNGCGFLGIYHVGVVAAIKHHLPDLKFKNICGASAGAMAAVCYLANVDMNEMTSELLKASVGIRNLKLQVGNPDFNPVNMLVESLDKLLPNDIHEMANGVLKISVTEVYSGENVLLDNFSSKRELINAVVASTFIPIFSGVFPFTFRGKKVIDGGFSKNQVVIEDGEYDTLTVSPFSGDAHISPNAKRNNPNEYLRVYFAEQGTDITVENIRRLMNVLTPPPPETMADILLQGYNDAVQFLVKHGQIDVNCTTCLTVKSKYTPAEVMALAEEDERRLEKEERKRREQQTGIRETSEDSTDDDMNEPIPELLPQYQPNQRPRRRKNKKREEQSFFSDALKKSVKMLKTAHDFSDFSLPSREGGLNKAVFDAVITYNPSVRIVFKMIEWSLRLAEYGCGAIEKFAHKYFGEVQQLKESAGDRFERILGYLMKMASVYIPFKYEHVMPTECSCEIDKHPKLRDLPEHQRIAKYSCDFHITQNDDDISEEEDEDELRSENEALENIAEVTRSVFSLSVETNVEERYAKWIKSVIGLAQVTPGLAGIPRGEYDHTDYELCVIALLWEHMEQLRIYEETVFDYYMNLDD